MTTHDFSDGNGLAPTARHENSGGVGRGDRFRARMLRSHDAALASKSAPSTLSVGVRGSSRNLSSYTLYRRRSTRRA